jgi:hypothetical protein
MVHGMGLIVMIVLETRCVVISQVEWHEGVAIIYPIKFSTFQKGFNIMLNDWILSNSSSLGSSCVHTNAISKSKDVFKSLMLESVWVNVNYSFLVGNA